MVWSGHDFTDMVPWSYTDIWTNPISIYLCPDVVEGTEDLLRKELGQIWKAEEPDLEEIETEAYVSTYTLAPPQIFVEGPDESIRGITTYKLESKSKYISKIEVNPVFIKAINDRTLVPNYRMPVRLYANEENTKGDKFWKELFSGGKFGENNFDNLMNIDRVFYDQVFSIPMPYSNMQTKIYSSAADASAVYKIQAKYFNYNEDVQRYQDWSSERSELLIPNIYSYWEVVSYGKMDPSPIAPESDDLIGWDIAALEDQSRELLDIYFNRVMYYMSPGASAFTNGYTDVYNEWVGAFPYHIHSSSTENVIKKMYKNIIYSTLNMPGGDEDTYESSLESINNKSQHILQHPYEINLKFPRYENTHSDVTGRPDEPKYWNANELNLTDGLPLRDIIEDHGLSSKFMEMLKDIDDGALAGLQYSEKSFVKQTRHVLSDIASDVQSEFSNIKLKSFDYLEFLSYLYNHFDDALNKNYFYPGYEVRKRAWKLSYDKTAERRSHMNEFRSTYYDNSLDRYNDSVKILQTMEGTLQYLRDYMELGVDMTEAHDGLDMEEGSDFEEQLSQYTTQSEQILRYLFNPANKKAEVLAYKIEKFEGNTQEGSSELLNLQNFWFFNSSLAAPYIEYKDTQVKYGKEYTYDCYAYVAVTGHKYRYREFRLTKMIGTIDENLDGVPEYYCVQFYDPRNMESADQLFATEFSLANVSYVGSNIGDVREILSESPRYTALSQRNEFATKNVDLSTTPHLADFYLDIEPCIKIFKIPMYSKKLGIYDSPGNTITSIPFQFLDNSKKIGFNVMHDDFQPNKMYPITISEEDRTLRSNYLNSKDLLATEVIDIFSESPARYIEMYRITSKPSSYDDFNNHLISRIDLKIKDSALTYADHMIADEIQPNKKYYYLFRFVTENGVPGELSKVLECQLIDDGGYLYSIFNAIEESDFVDNTLTRVSTSFKKVMQLEPNISQILINDTDVDYSKPAATQAHKVIIGDSGEDTLFDKKFKIRLTSKKTGKKLDINVNFNLRTENYTSTETWTEET
tara:strand:- start:6899 stop:9988 length:3090 start_codon:yes stop_codon:yes gene_type:complete